MSYNLPNPSLAGIILAVSTHNGPQIVFSYPENLSTRKLPSRFLDGDFKSENIDFDDEDYEAEDSDSSDIGNDSERNADNKWDVNHPNYYLGTHFDLMTFLEAREHRGHHVKSGKSKGRKKSVSCEDSPKSSTEKSSSASKVRPQQILGFEPEQLSEMLCPPKAMCNRRFDVMLENIVFLGYPVHVLSDGSWRAHRQRKATINTVKSEKKNVKKSEKENDEKMGNFVNEDTLSNPALVPQGAGGAMSMFHLVFVMDPPDIERNYRVDDMFFNVATKLAAVLRHEQQRHKYVWDQVRLISRLKEQLLTDPILINERFSDYLVSHSELCQTVAGCFDAISKSQIASLIINEKLRAFQIPLRTEFHSLPNSTVPYLPGSSLSSTIGCLGETGLAILGETKRYSHSSFTDRLLGTGISHQDYVGPNMNHNEDDDNSSSDPDDIVYLSLLLFDDVETIIAELKIDPGSAIARFIRMLRPTESLLKTSNILRQKSESKNEIFLSVAEIKACALHLVYWRRARVIAPLNTRAIYIVSPMAPIATNFHQDISRFSQQFPTVPSLPSFLRLLSTSSRKPRQFASIIPSRDHKHMYLLALAWLVRFGYVTQLHTYIWLKVPKKVKMKVEGELEEEIGRAPKISADGNSSTLVVRGLERNAHLPVDNSSKQVEADKALGRPISADAAIDQLQKKLEASSMIPQLILEDDEDTILVDPGRASSLERKWLNKIIHDECHLTAELTAMFYKLLKYMNGKSSLELLLLRENVSRSDLRRLLSEIDDYVISVRHW